MRSSGHHYGEKKRLLGMKKKNTVQIPALLALDLVGSIWSSVNSHCCGAGVPPYAHGCESVAWDEERQETRASLNWC